MKQKKKSIIKLILTILLLFTVTGCVQAASLFDNVTVRETNVFSIQTLGASTGEFTYTTNADGTITITGYTGNSTYLEIPSTYDGKTVKSIGVFAENLNLVEVIVPWTIKSIEANAFSACTNIKKVVIEATIHEHDIACEDYHFHNNECYEECIDCGGTGEITGGTCDGFLTCNNVGWSDGFAYKYKHTCSGCGAVVGGHNGSTECEDDWGYACNTIITEDCPFCRDRY